MKEVDGGPASLFVREGAVLHPTTLTRGPWDHGALHGGAVCAAVAWAMTGAQADPGLVLARMTVEIRSMVKLVALHTSTVVRKGGRRTQVIDGELHHAGRLLVRANSQWVAARPVGQEVPPGPRTMVPPRPECAADPAAAGDHDYPRPGFNCDAVEVRPIKGSTESEGPGLIWVRLRHPVVAGEATSPTLAVMALADLGIAVGWERSPEGGAFINPDVTLQLQRPPVGEWVLMASRSHLSGHGYGFCETVLSDDAGLFGRVLQTLVEAPSELSLKLGLSGS
jgi:hypothetical protein